MFYSELKVEGGSYELALSSLFSCFWTLFALTTFQPLLSKKEKQTHGYMKVCVHVCVRACVREREGEREEGRNELKACLPSLRLCNVSAVGGSDGRKLLRLPAAHLLHNGCSLLNYSSLAAGPALHTQF